MTLKQEILLNLKEPKTLREVQQLINRHEASVKVTLYLLMEEGSVKRTPKQECTVTNNKVNGYQAVTQ